MLNRGSRKKINCVPELSSKPDLWAYRVVVSTLSLTVVSCVVGSIWLQMNGQPTPRSLIVLGTSSIAAIAKVLSQSSKEQP